MNAKSRTRIRLISLFIVVFAALAVSRLFFIQVVRGADYQDAAERQYTTPAAQVFDRGAIFFREKGGELASAATLQSGFIVAVNPGKVADAAALYEALNALVPLERTEFMAKLAKTNDPYEEVARRVSREAADKINALNLPGVSMYKERWRFYPGRELGARVIGFVGYNNGSVLAGRYGLERYYEGILGRQDIGLYTNFFAQVFSDLGKTIFASNEREGDIILTIEPTVEKALHDELRGIMRDWNSDLAGGVVIDPKTGAIYAMEVLPGFDPNNLKSVNLKAIDNPLVEGVYEMGSIVKPLVMAAALDAGAVTPKTVYNDKGYVELDGYTIKNFDGKGRGAGTTMQEVLSQSLNTGMVFVQQRLGRDKFREYMKAYGLGVETGIDLPGETHGLIRNLESTRDVEYATASFGQGIAMTPIGTVRALSVLANGGMPVEPHLIETVDYKGGFSRKPGYNENTEPVIGKSASEEITRMLVSVVDKALLGGTVKIPEYSVAAKTGTAQMAKEDGKGYYDDRYLHSFFGYFPAYEPRFLVFLYTVNPKGVNYASHTLTHPFMRLTKFLLNYYEVPPDRPLQ